MGVYTLILQFFFIIYSKTTLTNLRILALHRKHIWQKVFMNMMPQALYSPIWGYPIFAEPLKLLGNEHSPLNSSSFF